MRSDRTLIDAYIDAKQFVAEAGFAQELDWQASLCFSRVTEQEFLREYAWVVLNCGMREQVVRRRFPAVSAAFLFWESSAAIAREHRSCKAAALLAFRNEAKIDAILRTAEEVRDYGFASVKDHIEQSGIEWLEGFPFIGRVTCLHLAKNIGLPVVKPDRHLVRAAAAAGFIDPLSMCEVISEETGDAASLVDLVVWRYSNLVRDYRHWQVD